MDALRRLRIGGRLPRPRRRWILLAALTAAVAVAVPVAWATFTDVPPSNPFYADINAIQGAGITSGCGGGNFCPTANITRMAEAAFVHRAASRMAQSTTITDTSIAYSTGYATDTIVGSVSIDVGGAPGGTQFVRVDATMSNYYAGGTTRPSYVGFYIADGACTGAKSPEMRNAIANAAWTDVTSSVSWTETVPTATTKTYRLCAYSWPAADNVTGAGAMTLDATTAPFGHSGGSVLGPGKQAGSERPRGK